MGFTLPEDCKCTKLYHGAANAVDCDIISLKNAHKAVSDPVTIQVQ